MREKNIVCAMLIIIAVSIGIPLSATAQTVIDDSVSLNGIKEAKGIFLIDFTNPKKTDLYLKAIKGTHQGLVEQGAKPDMILVVIGQTVKYFTTEPDGDLLQAHESELKSISETIREFHALGIRMEVCAAATKVFGVDNQTIFPEMSVVGNGFISLIGWQTQGYQLVPIF